MDKVCLLKGELNHCEYLGEEQKCNAPHTQCGMLVKLDYKEVIYPRGYVRQPRWYEKYYTKK